MSNSEDGYKDGQLDPRIPLLKPPDESVVKLHLSRLRPSDFAGEDEESSDGESTNKSGEDVATSHIPHEDAIRSYGGLQKVSEVAHVLIQRPIKLDDNVRLQEWRIRITPICASIKKEVNVLTMLFSKGCHDGVPKTTKEIAKHLNELTKVIRHINAQAMPQLKKQMIQSGSRVLCAVASLAEIGTNYGNPTLACGLVWDALERMTTCPRTNGAAIAQEFDVKLRMIADAREEMTKELNLGEDKEGCMGGIRADESKEDKERDAEKLDDDLLDFSYTALEGQALEEAIKALNLIKLTWKVLEHITRFVRWLKGGNIKTSGRITELLSKLYEKVMKFDALVDNLVVEVMYDRSGEETARAQELREALIELVSCAQRSSHFSRRKMVIREGERSRKILSPTMWLKNIMKLLDQLDFSPKEVGTMENSEAQEEKPSEEKSSSNPPSAREEALKK